MKKTEKFPGWQYGMIWRTNYDMLPVSGKEEKYSCIRTMDTQVIPVPKTLAASFQGF